MNWYSNLTPENKKYLSIGVAVVIVLVIFKFLNPFNVEGFKSKPRSASKIKKGKKKHCGCLRGSKRTQCMIDYDLKGKKFVAKKYKCAKKSKKHGSKKHGSKK